ncbi:MAG: cell division protein FtsK [Cycloclasticus sp. symbiont of Poecilosclerida sp. N]|nr:MAG: cell division protein FtsK [Cycloclasticus sp. symbiont of Poecilosclerida sp. N]
MNRKITPKPALVAQHQIVKLLRESAFLAFLAMGSFLLASLFSYNVNDAGWNYSGSSQIAQNITGVVGAWVADFMLSMIGFMAFAFPFMLFSSAWKFLSEAKTDHPDTVNHQVIRWASFVFFLIAGAGLLDMHYYQNWLTIPNSAGGIVGLELSDALRKLFALEGATLVLFSVFLIGITLSTGLSWLGLMDKLGALAISLCITIRNAIEDSRERKTSEQIKKKRGDSFRKQSKIFSAKPRAHIDPVIKEIKTSARVDKERQVGLFEENFSSLPALALLDVASKPVDGYSKAALEAMSKLVELKLQDFGVDVNVVAVNPGPVITRFEIQPAPGIKASRISSLAKDLARSMSTHSVRVVEVIPGKSVVGLEIPNESREMVRLGEILSSEEYEKSNSALTLVLGKNISGQPTVADLAKMPHLLVAGTTGSGKSVAINAMILSLLYKATPEQVRMIMIDPKMLELSVYEGIPHLLTPVVTDMKEAANALRWSVAEMERRYKLMSLLGVRNLSGYNKKVRDAIKEGSPLADPLWEPTAFIDEEEAGTLSELPQIVIIIDELADMMMVVGKKVEELIARLAQKARASGLHLVLATQRPSVDVLTGLIKANIPSRIAFQVSSKIDSRTILDQSGAETLLGNGDMLYLPPGSGLPQRVHGAFVDDHEVHKVVKQLKSQGAPNYVEGILTSSDPAEFDGGSGDQADSSDELYDQALKIVTQTRRASISGVQRQLRVGYNRAARMIEEMERCGVVGPLQTNGSREVLAPPPPEL